MKKIGLIASLATIGFAVTAFIVPKASTDSTFEGVITYSISVDNPQMASMMQGSSMKVYIKGDKTKTMMDMGMYKQIVISDRKTPDDPIVLKEVMGNKYQVKNDKTKKDEKDPVIKYSDEIKQIAGYTCHKAEVAISDDQGQPFTSSVYYTTDIPSPEEKEGQFKGLKGFPMEFSVRKQGMNILMTATTVEKKSLTDDIFAVPSGYKLMTQEEIQADMQKNMGGGGN